MRTTITLDDNLFEKAAEIAAMEPELLFRYFGIDWIAMIFTFFAIYLLGNKSRYGFAVMIAGNACWITVGFMTSSLAMAIANAGFLLMNARGWHRWAPD